MRSRGCARLQWSVPKLSAATFAAIRRDHYRPGRAKRLSNCAGITCGVQSETRAIPVPSDDDERGCYSRPARQINWLAGATDGTKKEIYHAPAKQEGKQEAAAGDYWFRPAGYCGGPGALPLGLFSWSGGWRA